MIRVIDTLTMAYTKLRTRKVRTAFTVAIAGILFGLVMAIVIISDGVFMSVERMTQKSMTGRFIVGGSTAYQDVGDVSRDQDGIAEALLRHKTLVADKKAEAKRLGIEYDAAMDPSPVETFDGQQMLSYSSPIGQAVMNELYAKAQPTRTMDDFKQFADKYQPTVYYEARPTQPKDGALTEMKAGKEAFTQTDTSKQGMSGAPPDLQEATLVPKALLSSYLLPNAKWSATSGRIPVVVSQKRATQLTGYKAPGADAPAAERLNYLNELRSRVNGATFSACYRNTASSEQITEALSVAKEIAAKKNDKTYQRPSLIYGLPDESSCGAAVVVRDVRTAAEKQYADKLMQFNRKFGAVVDPVQQKVTYEVVGVAPNGWADMDMGFSLGVKDIVASLLMSQSFRFAVPTELYESMPNKTDYANVLSTQKNTDNMGYMGSGGQYFAEFANATDARNFAKNESCQYGMTGCEPRSKYFVMAPFGSNSIGLDEVKHGVSVALLWTTGIVTILAAVIAGLTIGRTIADGRRETAVFRAIGFKRMDINQIYVTYTLLLCLRIAIFALLIGLGAALLVHSNFWIDTTIQAQLALGVFDSGTQFSFVGFTPKILVIVGAILLAGVAGMAIPLLRNTARNPIRDMRDE